ncbi:MAG TPA: diacylglycerol kinase [Candidatus Magasanikbacteria bacterium]|nr:diacylglycerol kinase [Candidatus Magasanikbacteria bacterium]
MGKRKISDSFQNAFCGLKYAWQHEQNFRIQIFGAIVVLLFALFFDLRKYEIVTIGLLITLVLILELVNSAIEHFLDVISPRLSDQVRAIKDIMAGAVVVASCGAIVIGIAIFWPYIFEFIGIKW